MMEARRGASDRDARTEESAMIPPDEQASVASERRRADEATSAAKIDSTGANLDKVRDILFGSQLREIDRRLTRLEERQLKDMNDLKSDVKSRLDAFDSYMRHETEALTGQIQTERHDRGSTDEQLSKGQRELRQQLLDQHQHLSGDIRRKIDSFARPASCGRTRPIGPRSRRCSPKWRCG
jgi:hypothetical protein